MIKGWFQDENVISYPKIGVQYDPKQVNAWSNLRGFQNPAQVYIQIYGCEVTINLFLIRPKKMDPDPAHEYISKFC